MTSAPPAALYLLLLALGFFFGLAFEEFHAKGGQARPGGVRTFPLLALAGGLLYRLDSARLLPLSAGLIVLGLWLAIYYWQHIGETDPEGQPNVGLMAPICSVLAYLLGPTVFAEPPWVAIGVTVAAVLLLTAREKLHGLARRLEVSEIITAGKFLILTGLVLPFLPDTPVTSLTTLTPHKVWLAVLAVCTVSYASYLLQRYITPKDGGLWTALLGGLYSSTATTVVLARRAGGSPGLLRQTQSGIILATAIMYLRMLIIVAMFDWPLAVALAPALVGLAVFGLVMAGLWQRLGKAPHGGGPETEAPRNPLELMPALIFALLFVVVSVASVWVRARYGAAGIYGLAAIVGTTDIDPFVLSLASGGAAPLPLSTEVAAILIAASSNNVLKALYAGAFGGRRVAVVPGTALAVLALAGCAVAWWMAGIPG